MNRLTETALPLTTFNKCQICGFESKDICEFHMWLECDDQDKPESGNILITCRQDTCQKVITDHDRLYYQLGWGKGEPGWFILLCGDCKFRKGNQCLHPKLKKNGGEGLEIIFHNYGKGAIICYQSNTSSEDELRCRPLDWCPASKCEGRQT
jgi:hypothetical protein